MKICMGGKLTDAPIGSVEPHFGYPFVVQKDHTLVCTVPDYMQDVARVDLRMGRIMRHETYMKQIEAEQEALDDRLQAMNENLEQQTSTAKPGKRRSSAKTKAAQKRATTAKQPEPEETAKTESAVDSGTAGGDFTIP